ncbi:hypothetical protein N7492_006445 [Penicillium capsulatum]|uniref:Uncharacterized protein n=1 Tax=Penicillium capsulatum TaxID=69766 RepID=A0A9W9I089_9EURO|nr:hypothetical protein N7492_006445 [Penicillium capsulatum]KAJ6116285.1 hypothetical protein N7512_006010 [Penicillium capsulatum]
MIFMPSSYFVGHYDIRRFVNESRFLEFKDTVDSQTNTKEPKMLIVRAEREIQNLGSLKSEVEPVVKLPDPLALEIALVRYRRYFIGLSVLQV